MRQKSPVITPIAAEPVWTLQCDVPEYGLKKGQEVLRLRDGDLCGDHPGHIIRFKHKGKIRTGFLKHSELAGK